MTLKKYLIKKILVTGGLGCIGSHAVVELHNNKFDVLIIDDLSNSSLKVLNSIKKITGFSRHLKKLIQRIKNPS